MTEKRKEVQKLIPVYSVEKSVLKNEAIIDKDKSSSVEDLSVVTVSALLPITVLVSLSRHPPTQRVQYWSKKN